MVSNETERIHDLLYPIAWFVNSDVQFLCADNVLLGVVSASTWNGYCYIITCVFQLKGKVLSLGMSMVLLSMLNRLLMRATVELGGISLASLKFSAEETGKVILL